MTDPDNGQKKPAGAQPQVLYIAYSGCAHEGYAMENDGRIFSDLNEAIAYIEKMRSQGLSWDWELVQMNLSEPGIWVPG